MPTWILKKKKKKSYGDFGSTQDTFRESQINLFIASFVFGTKDDHIIMSCKVVHDVLTNRKQKSLENVVIHIMALSLSTCLHSLVCHTYHIKQSILSNNHFFLTPYTKIQKKIKKKK